MIVYCWQAAPGVYNLDRNRPEAAANDDPASGRRAGRVYGGIGTVSFLPPDDLLPSLPPAGEVREMMFHRDLWGVAQGLPSYEKSLWLSVQRMLGD